MLKELKINLKIKTLISEYYYPFVSIIKIIQDRDEDKQQAKWDETKEEKEEW